MKILYYNWTPLFDPLRRGGGVRIYQESLIRAALLNGHDVTYLSAGVRYNALKPGLRVIRRVHGAHPTLCELEIVNSPVFAPSHHQFGRNVLPDEEERYAEFILQLIATEGPFDVFHLNNLEGLPLSLFFERARLSPGRVLLSLHNYHLLCQQVNLWHAERTACDDFDNGRRCTHCVVPPSRAAILGASTFHDVISPVFSEGTSKHAVAFRVYSRLKRLMRVWISIRDMLIPMTRPAQHNQGGNTNKLWAGAEKFVEHRRSGTRIISDGIDKALSVSSRVTDIFVRYGAPRNKIATRYIATQFAENFDPQSYKRRSCRGGHTDGKPIHLAYLGYARDDKGFFFLVKALASMPANLQKRIRLTFAASGTSVHRAWMETLLIHFADCSIVDGYVHADLPELLSDVDLGVIPVVWEDCLPQVAYEFICHGVPILASDMGGASELIGAECLVFKAGDAEAFVGRVSHVVNNPETLSQFWDNPRMPILNWKAHWAELFEFYSSGNDLVGDILARKGATCPTSP